ncbi:hypothetical protein [Paraburkholderia sp. DHOC27]|uniref:hypothetical protein n=1 Tax=Paraburkholderia sp. DHOC27 TaxID=2303330 RepID=UPI0011C10195|nr:hypothetical protein [Paraburkholderia sp. DHOC27]
MGNSNLTNGGSDTRKDTHVPVSGSSTRDHYVLPVGTRELAQSQLRNNSAIPGSNGCIRNVPAKPLPHNPAKPTMGRK